MRWLISGPVVISVCLIIYIIYIIQIAVPSFKIPNPTETGDGPSERLLEMWLILIYVTTYHGYLDLEATGCSYSSS